MTTIEQNIQQIQQRIINTAQNCDRDPKQIQLLAVSKTKPVTLIEEAIQAGQRQFGENYVQEGVDKINYFAQHHPKLDLIWHFIGPLQSNKTKQVAEHFGWIHTIDRLKIAQRLNDQRPAHLPKLNVLIQINISDEQSKSGIAPNELFDLAKALQSLPNLKLRGLMAIPKPESNPEKQLIAFNHMQQLYKQLQQQYTDIDTLSMGMSNDMQTAIYAGSTMVRIGTALFGARQYAD
ncbi:YggS family pyridoxal phosphate-dependent enzyme [Orbaceae bacterium ac157xtp]